MKKKDLNDLKTKTVQDLRKKVADLEKEKNNNLLELKMGRSKNVHAANNIKKDIAKVKTLIEMKTLTREESEKGVS